MSSSTREEVLQHLQTVGQLQPALHKQTHAPAPTEITHTLYRAYTRSAHDVGGEYDVPIEWHEKEEEVWELNTFATCECLAWRGVWTAEERRRRQNVDVGQTIYLGLPYYGRWLMTAALILIDKQYVTLTELHDKIEEVRKRYEQS
ncbi:SH3-like domain-containing protein [Thioalkalivibrio thiocyanodenitrificans]|uniref:SH3-like domain-containing protein n=1 Tax=Thioalkalivibrio thiocyanodenitrificans TaxID=243063 RepID=UPI0018DD4EFC|nr:SH3-like domain-containing protein [Thioalkalivibrio thiocyanodenitrificans]